MFSKICGQFNWRSGKTRMALAAAICVVGLMAGAGGRALLAQLKEPNPLALNEGVGPCINAVTCSDNYLECTPLVTSVAVDAAGGPLNPNGYAPVLPLISCGIILWDDNAPCGDGFVIGASCIGGQPN